MTTKLHDALLLFRDKVNADPRLKAMNKDWSRTIRVQPTDGIEALRIRYEGGVMEIDADVARAPDIVLMAPEDVLVGIFSGTSSPTEPYLEGTLTIQGTQEDVLRLDFLSLMIWGE